MSQHVYIVLSPLIGSMIAGLFGRYIGNRLAQAVTIIGMMVSAGLAIAVFMQVAVGDADPIQEKVLTWIISGDFTVSFGLLIDRITAIMLIVVSGISTLIHIYSIGYMAEDPDQPRFFSYLSFFTFAMLMLVTGDSFLQLFFGWEGVGLASYLLIGFWFKKESACNAAMKAFLVNRVGDFGFALGIFAIYMVFGTLDYEAVFRMAGSGQYPQTIDFLFGPANTITVICLLLFVGAMGKSAQFILHTWLPDAMEGPTPVSALIHAATMVTAGVFMVSRASPLFELSETALAVVTIIGATTAFFAATVGLVQNDIKRVIAYSTCSQLGYMFFAAGVSAYAAAMFHLMTHAFFKALLFLGSGAVIHAMHHEQDMRKMGGLVKKIPFTYAMMMIGTLALTGFPYLFAGFYSKDAILESAYAAHTSVGMFAWVLGIIAAFMTTFYSFRLVFMTFHGKPGDQHAYDHAHEAPFSMQLPNLVLAVGAIGAGYVGLPLIAEGWFKDAIILAPGHDALKNAHHVGLFVKWLPFAMFLGGLILAWILYIRKPTLPGFIAEQWRGTYRFLLNAWYFDKLYDRVFVRMARRIGEGLWKTGDETMIDGYGVNGIAATCVRLAQQLKQFQTGYVYHYAFAMLIGVLVLVSVYT